MEQEITGKMTNYRWSICTLLFMALTINYLDRQVLSLTWEEFIKPQFHWDDNIYGTITGTFSLLYAAGMLISGRFIDWLGTKKGFLWAIGVWSFGGCIHAVCGIVTEHWVGLHSAAELMSAVGTAKMAVATVSMWCFLVARAVLAVGAAGNFPAAVKVTAEYFPKKDRAFSTSIFNAGAPIGALIAPILIPNLAKSLGWEMAFVIIGALGFVWMGFWVLMYNKPQECKFVNQAELDYIESDKLIESEPAVVTDKKMPFFKCFTYRQTWAFAFGKFMSDGPWWFFLFWTPSYLFAQFEIKTTDFLGQALIFTLYGICTIMSIYGGKLPTIFMNRSGSNPYAARMKAMLIFAFIPLCVLFAQPLGVYFHDTLGLGQTAAWIPVLLIAIALGAHQSWSANIFTTVSDMFPKAAIGSIVGIGGMAGGIGSLMIQKTAGKLFTYAEATNMHFMGFEGKPAGYFIIFIFCALAYLIGWSVMKTLVPKYKPITDY